MDESRKQFEDFLLKELNIPASIIPEYSEVRGKYLNWDIDFSWQAWQASREAMNEK